VCNVCWRHPLGQGGTVVYALSAIGLSTIVGRSPDDLLLSCREVFARSQRPIEVLGPALEAEAKAVHAGFWSR
jgi:hypothetical protein